MAYTDLINIKKELTNFLRNQDILSTSVRGVTTTSDGFLGTTAGVETFNLSNSTLKNIRSVTIGGTAQTFGSDYSFDYDNATLTVNNSVVGLTTSVSYDYGSTDHIWDDFPQDKHKLSDYPRIGFDILSGTSEEVELGAETTLTEYPLTIVCYSANKDQVEELVASVRNKLLENKKSFYYSPFITATGMGPRLVAPWGNDKIFQRNQDFLIRFIYEN